MKLPMTPDEFDRKCREFERGCARVGIYLFHTSGLRSMESNARTDGSIHSKHLFGMAKDYGLGAANELLLKSRREAICDIAEDSAWWWKPYWWGIHLQGLPPGPVPKYWAEKYGVPDYIEVGET